MEGTIAVSKANQFKLNIIENCRTGGVKLSIAEKQDVLDLLHGEDFVEDTPYQVVSKL